MNAIKHEVKQLVSKELAAANEKFPLFNSVHEAYAVLLEEHEECGDAQKEIEKAIQDFWGCVKGNTPILFLEDANRRIKEHAVELAIEAVQVAAMADKFTLSFVRNCLDGEE